MLTGLAVIQMSIWDDYESRREAYGKTKRDMWLVQTRATERRRMLDSASCREVQINDVDQTVCIVHTAEMDQKKIYSLPGEHLEHGGIVTFADNKWLITEMDADNIIYDKGIMQQCNHVLRWISKDGTLKEKWCYVADGTKYLIGERTRELLTIGDARIAVTVGKDADTIELARGLRFLIDDTDSEAVLAYQITKPNKMFNVFNGKGVFRFILNEVQLTPNDNKELRIADFYNWKPGQELDSDHKDGDYTVAEIVNAATTAASETPDDDKKGWL